MASPLLSYSLILCLLVCYVDGKGKIGVNWGLNVNDLLDPTKVVDLLKTHGINRVKLYDTDSSILKALADSNIYVVVAMPNELLVKAAVDQAFTDEWVHSNILSHVPATNIISIAVGNEVIADPSNTTEHLVAAMNNVYNSLTKVGLSDIKIGSPIALISCLDSSYPASSGSFKPELIEPVIKPMLDILRKSNAPLMINTYPFFAYAANSDTISLDYALLKDNKGVSDVGSGLIYTSVFDAQVDAVFSAMKAIQYADIKISVTETGWPSAGDENEIGATHDNAAAYYGNLVKRVLTGKGTPMKPDEPLEVYLFTLFNENHKNGPTSERNYGLFYPNLQKVYDITYMHAISGSKKLDLCERKQCKDKMTRQPVICWCCASPGFSYDYCYRLRDACLKDCD